MASIDKFVLESHNIWIIAETFECYWNHKSIGHGILDIYSDFLLLWIGRNGHRSIWSIQWWTGPMQLVSVSDWVATNASHIHGERPTAGHHSRIRQHIVHTRSFQTGNWFKPNFFHGYYLWFFVYRRWKEDFLTIQCYIRSMDEDLSQTHHIIRTFEFVIINQVEWCLHGCGSSVRSDHHCFFKFSPLKFKIRTK